MGFLHYCHATLPRYYLQQNESVRVAIKEPGCDSSVTKQRFLALLRLPESRSCNMNLLVCLGLRHSVVIWASADLKFMFLLTIDMGRSGMASLHLTKVYSKVVFQVFQSLRPIHSDLSSTSSV